MASNCRLAATTGCTATHVRLFRFCTADGEALKIALNILGVLLVLFGLVWFLQGINVLPGSFMTGQIRWAVYGGIAVVAGVTLVLVAKRCGGTGRR
jgi:hypothetical protein